IKWIRLLYCYPEEIDDELINEIKNNDKIVKYLDIPLQHISNNILKAMNRRSSYESICALFDKLKYKIPSLVLRTTFIVGFPNEQESDVNLVSDFLKKYKLNNVGFFAYSREEGTKSYNLDNQIDESTKNERLDRLSNIQFNVVQENNSNLIGKIFEVIIDEVHDNYSIGRYYGQSPMIDTVIYINECLNVGSIYNIKITNKSDYDLEGERV
ncbi:MAG: radical SAM protein, partial [Christensenellales bacterium]